VVIIHDATWRQFTETYPRFSKADLAEETYASGFTAEKLAFGNAAYLMFLTPWAANGAANEYPDFRNKIHVMLPGANLTNIPEHIQIEEDVRRRRAGNCHILFVGGDAMRKGVDIAIGATRLAQKQIGSAILDLVGVGIKESLQEAIGSFVAVHGFLDKGDSGDETKIAELYRNAFAFLLPSRAECAGIVLCEAAGFGVPAITSGVGGTADLVIHGQTGWIVGANGSPKNYADLLGYMWQNPDVYLNMCIQARRRYETSLKWDIGCRYLERVLTAKR
jgi:glycosyltransferase involved in cell wall biosynthesis